MKNQRGITLTILVITVIMMALIFGAISYNSVSSYRLNAYYIMCADIELLDEKIALYYLENKDKESEKENFGLPIILNESKPIQELITNYSTENVNYNPNNSGTLYKIELGRLDNLSIQNADYYIDPQSHTIYAGTGRKIENETYYTVPVHYQAIDLNQYQ